MQVYSARAFAAASYHQFKYVFRQFIARLNIMPLSLNKEYIDSILRRTILAAPKILGKLK